MGSGLLTVRSDRDSIVRRQTVWKKDCCRPEDYYQICDCLEGRLTTLSICSRNFNLAGGVGTKIKFISWRKKASTSCRNAPQIKLKDYLISLTYLQRLSSCNPPLSTSFRCLTADRSNPRGKLSRKAFPALVALAGKKDEVPVPWTEANPGSGATSQEVSTTE